MIIASAIAMFVVCGLFFAATNDVAAKYDSERPFVRIYDQKVRKLLGDFNAFDSSFKGGESIAIGDVDGDGTDEIVVGTGPGPVSQVRIYDNHGNKVGSFFPYEKTQKNGINVAVGDLDNDGKAEIVIGRMYGTDCKIEIYQKKGSVFEKYGKFLPFKHDFKYGVSLAIGDTNGDGTNEIIAASGLRGSAKIRMYSMDSKLLRKFSAFGDDRYGGISLATGDLNNNGRDEIVLAEATHGKRENLGVVRTFEYSSGKFNMNQEFTPYGKKYRGGIRVAVGDINGDGAQDIVTSVFNSDSPPLIKAFTKYGKSLEKDMNGYSYNYRGGINIAIGDIDNGRDKLVVVPSTYEKLVLAVDPSWRGGSKRIVVDLSEQRLYAYEGQREANTFLISSGIPMMPTPTGHYHMSQKIYNKHYVGNYGPGNPLNFDLPNTLYNMRIGGTSFLLHGAYWHNNFGHRMSHGCVNISYANAAWLWAWAPIGTTIDIVQ